MSDNDSADKAAAALLPCEIGCFNRGSCYACHYRKAVAAKLCEIRRDALEEGAKAMCEWCRAAEPYKISGSVRWWHQDGICESAPIRNLIEKEEPSEPRD